MQQVIELDRLFVVILWVELMVILLRLIVILN